jgi:hypothetical protein
MLKDSVQQQNLWKFNLNLVTLKINQTFFISLNNLRFIRFEQEAKNFLFLSSPYNFVKVIDFAFASLLPLNSLESASLTTNFAIWSVNTATS